MFGHDKKQRKSYDRLRRKLSQPASTTRFLKSNQENHSPINIRSRISQINTRFDKVQNLSHLLKRDTKFFLKSINQDYSMYNKKNQTAANSQNTSFN